MTGVEIDMVVSDSLSALALYEGIFDIQRVEVTDLEKGSNEAIFTLYGMRFHMLDENEEYQMIAPKPDASPSIWYNILVEDIKDTYKKAMDAGCTEIQPVTEIPDFGAANAMFADPFGYVWMLHEMHHVVSFEDRVAALENKREHADES